MSRVPVALVACLLIGAGVGSCNDRPGKGVGGGSDAGDGPRDGSVGGSSGTGGSGAGGSRHHRRQRRGRQHRGRQLGGRRFGRRRHTTGTGGAAAGGSTGMGGTTAGTGGTTTGTGGTTTTGGSGGNASAGCPVSPSQCTDGIDNDMDGQIDGFDPECSGPL